MIIRSYGVCFQIERRLYRVDRWRLPAPNGVPLRGIGYGVALLLAVLVLNGLPGPGWFLGTLHPVVRYTVLPIGAAYALVRWTIDGRPAHRAGLSLTRWALAPRRLVAFRPAPALGPVRLGSVTIAPDERQARMRHGRVDGPATVILRYPARAHRRGRTLRVRQLDGPPRPRGMLVRVHPGQHVVIE